MKYKDRLKQSTAEIKAADIAYEVERATLEADLEIMKIKKTIADFKQRVNSNKNDNPISFERITSTINALELEQRKLLQVEKIYKELF